MSKQLTIKQAFTVSGIGLHTGLDVTLIVSPAPVNTGYVIRRVDLEGCPEIPALAENVCDTQRSTILKRGEATISTVEHCLAALYAAGVDNCYMDVNAPEFPILEGSAVKYANAIAEVGVEEQNEDKDYFIVNKKITYTSEDGKSVITLLPDNEFTAQVLISYQSPILNNQFAILDNMSQFAKEIAVARTFVFVREIEPLLKANLIKGGDLNNAIVIYDQETNRADLERIAEIMQCPCPEISNFGYINTDLYFDNEPARHKLLDLIGDLALIGKPIKGRVIAQCPGHAANTAFAKQMRKDIRKQEISAPHYDVDVTPLFDINKIKTLLPHRYPFLLVDKVMEIYDNTIVAVKNVTYNEMHFIGHFPEEPVMPGVLHVEAMAQCAGLLVLSQYEDPESYSTYFLKIDGVKFRNKVVPGDQLIMKVFLTSPIRRGLASIKGYCFVDGKIVTEAEMTAQIVKNK